MNFTMLLTVRKTWRNGCKSTSSADMLQSIGVSIQERQTALQMFNMLLLLFWWMKTKEIRCCKWGCMSIPCGANISFTKGQTLLHIIAGNGLPTLCGLVLGVIPSTHET